ncbi:MAG: sigma-70 family RNA polymerase sigma factor [Byssovorax sp.]
MTPRDADVRLRTILDEHGRGVARFLVYYGVSTADQEDMTQEVFLTAHKLLLGDNHPVLDGGAAVWRGWLREIARRHAANYRHKGRPIPTLLAEIRDLSASDPEKVAARRELLVLLLDTLDPESREIFLDVNAEGLSWSEIAVGHGMTINRARYLNARAASRMEAVLLGWEKGESGAGVVLIGVAELLAAVPPAGAVPDEMYRRVHDAIDRHQGAAARPRDLRRWPLRAAGLPSHAAVLLFGGLVGWALHRPPEDLSPAVLISSPGERAVLAAGVPIPSSHDLPPSEAPAAATATRLLPPAARPLNGSDRKVPGLSDDEHLLDQAQAALNAGDAHAALAALAKRDGHFGSGPAVSIRQRLLLRACALAGAGADPECDGSGAAPTN